MKKAFQDNLKKEIRKAVLEKRAEIDADEKKKKDSAIREKLFSLREFKDAEKILFYASFRDEVDTLSIIEEVLRSGKRVMVPRVEGQGLAIHEIKNRDAMSPGFMGIPEPKGLKETLSSIDEVELVVMPGVAFDMKGNRLGYGKGYYDKLLSKSGKRKPLIALAYETQMLKHIPSETHDIRVDKIITEERVIDCNGHRKD